MRQAPDFSLLDQNGTRHRLSDYTGRWLVLYFYPKDDTPGCTTEACNFRDSREAIRQLGNAEVIGISMDTVADHKRFATKHRLNFPLLSDPDHMVISAYGAWKPKKLFGREFFGITRSTFIINPEGYIVKEYPRVDVQTHAAEIIRELRILQAPS